MTIDEEVVLDASNVLSVGELMDANRGKSVEERCRDAKEDKVVAQMISASKRSKPLPEIPGDLDKSRVEERFEQSRKSIENKGAPRLSGAPSQAKRVTRSRSKAEPDAPSGDNGKEVSSKTKSDNAINRKRKNIPRPKPVIEPDMPVIVEEQHQMGESADPKRDNQDIENLNLVSSHYDSDHESSHKDGGVQIKPYNPETTSDELDDDTDDGKSDSLQQRSDGADDPVAGERKEGETVDRLELAKVTEEQGDKTNLDLIVNDDSRVLLSFFNDSDIKQLFPCYLSHDEGVMLLMPYTVLRVKLIAEYYSDCVGANSAIRDGINFLLHVGKLASERESEDKISSKVLSALEKSCGEISLFEEIVYVIGLTSGIFKRHRDVDTAILKWLDDRVGRIATVWPDLIVILRLITIIAIDDSVLTTELTNGTTFSYKMKRYLEEICGKPKKVGVPDLTFECLVTKRSGFKVSEKAKRAHSIRLTNREASVMTSHGAGKMSEGKRGKKSVEKHSDVDLEGYLKRGARDLGTHTKVIEGESSDERGKVDPKAKQENFDRSFYKPKKVGVSTELITLPRKSKGVEVESVKEKQSGQVSKKKKKKDLENINYESGSDPEESSDLRAPIDVQKSTKRKRTNEMEEKSDSEGQMSQVEFQNLTLRSIRKLSEELTTVKAQIVSLVEQLDGTTHAEESVGKYKTENFRATPKVREGLDRHITSRKAAESSQHHPASSKAQGSSSKGKMNYDKVNAIYKMLKQLTTSVIRNKAIFKEVQPMVYKTEFDEILGDGDLYKTVIREGMKERVIDRFIARARLLKYIE